MTEHHQGAPGLAHGGLLTAAVDEILGLAELAARRPGGHRPARVRLPAARAGRLRCCTSTPRWSASRAARSSPARWADSTDPTARSRSRPPRCSSRCRSQHFVDHGAAEHVQQAIDDRAAGGPAWRPEGEEHTRGAEPMTDVDVLITRLDPDLPLPAYEHPGDAGLDLRSRVDLTLAPGERALVPTGIAIALPPGYAAFVLRAQRACAPARRRPGERTGDRRRRLPRRDRRRPRQPRPGRRAFAISRGDRIAQLVVQRVEHGTPASRSPSCPARTAARAGSGRPAGTRVR